MLIIQQYGDKELIIMVINIIVNGNDYIQEILTWVCLQHDVAS